MVKITGAPMGKALVAATMALGMGCGVANAGDGFTGDVSASYNSHFVSYGADTWGAGHKLFSGLSPTFVNGDLYYTKGDFTATGNVWFDILGGDDIGNNNPLGGSIQEVDLNLGLAYAIGKVTVGATYGFWNYGGDTEGVLDLSVALNDADMMVKGFALNPKVLAHIRTEEGAGQVDTGAAIVVSVAPTLSVLGPVSLSFPAGVAFFTSSDFQGGTKSGYAYSYAGASLSYTLPVPEGYGTWSIFTDWIGYFTEKDALPFNHRQNFLTADVGLKLAF